MSAQLIIFISIFMIVYGLANFYVGWRGWQAVNYIMASPRWAWCWALLAASMAASYPLGRWVSHFVPHLVAKILVFIGSYWMAALYYLLLIFLVSDLLRIANRIFNFLPLGLRGKFPLLIVTVIVLVAILLVYGTWNAHHPVVTYYEIQSDRKSSTLQELNIVAVSDIHLGWIVGIDQLQHMTEMISALEPDLVVLVGDIVDEGVDLSAEREMPRVLHALQPRLGTFAVMGNHEYISGQVETTIGFLNQNGVTVLRDQMAEIKDALFIVGRDDGSRHRLNGATRRDLSELMEMVDDQRLPVVLLDHEPTDLQTAESTGVDLMFSGHTHLGQLFPNNLITQAIYEQDWGYLRKGNLQLIVSAGYGTWGPPIRIGNRPEIVNVRVHFKDPDTF